MRLVELTSHSSLWFRHQSPNRFDVLKPISYESLKASRENDVYVDERKDHEDEFRKILHNSDPHLSFLYSTVVGYHQMTSASDYPGFTFYFRLNEAQIEECLFFVVNKNEETEHLLGMNGLRAAINFWNKNLDKLERAYDPILDDWIDPRIEVVTQQPIRYQKFVPQIEDRT